MAQMLKKIFCFALLTCGAVVVAGSSNSLKSVTIIKPRSVSFNVARTDAGWNSQIHKYDMDETYGSLHLTVGGGQSFRTANLVQGLFGNDVTFNKTATTTTNNVTCRGRNTAQFTVQGSQVAGPTASKTSWLADYFGLARDFDGDVIFAPKISTAFVDFNFYLGLDEWAQGLFFRLNAPLVWTRWSLNASENIRQAGTIGFPNGYMSPGAGLTTSTGIPASSLAKSFLAATNGSNIFGDMKTPLAYGIFNNGTSNVITTTGTTCNKGLSRTRVSDVQVALGYNFVLDEDYHFGVQVLGSGPAGGRPKAVNVFEPIVGNGGHWTLGGGVTGHATFWRSDCEDSSFGFYVDANVTHLFKSCQLRPFDFVNKPNSRYMLLAEMNGSSAGAPTVFAGPAATTDPVVPTLYTGNLYPAINFTTLNANVSFGAQGELALKFVYMNGGFSWDLGYDLWGRTSEKVCLKGSLDTKRFVLKGDASVYGFANGASQSYAVGQPAKLSISQNSADIHDGQGVGNFLQTTATNNYLNLNADNPALAWQDSGGTVIINNLPIVDAINAPLVTKAQVNTSTTAKFIATSDLDTSNGPSALTNKIFSHIGYAWIDNECWVPFLGVGGEAEFGSGNGGSCSTTTSCGSRCAISQWNVWLKGGVSF